MGLLALATLLWVIGLVFVVALCRAAARGDARPRPEPDLNIIRPSSRPRGLP